MTDAPTAIPTAFAPDQWARADRPLGPTPDARTGRTTFAVHAPEATRVLLEIHRDATGSDPIADFDLVRGPDGAWRAELSGVGHGTLYGFRCWGPNWPAHPDWTRGGSAAGFVVDVDADGHRFNPNKLLIDPYAAEITHSHAAPDVRAAGGDGGWFGTGGDPHHGRPRRELDTGRLAGKSVLVVDDTPTGERPRLAPEDAIIYEAHIRNLTAHPSARRLGELFARAAGFDGIQNVPAELPPWVDLRSTTTTCRPRTTG
ncbi:hypothetical protein [Enemella dayhoffiae]|uniref:hypothetical protein n=1 Tax=Enemella dayhoffiae TaxID=2016507 RepID=UPI0015955691|nr:hypothetical protein [Enemella dayhoffiae]